MDAVGGSGVPARRTATFALGDVVGSTRLWADRPEWMPEALARLDSMIDAACAAHLGERAVEQGEGDSFVVVFAQAADAIAFAIDVQRDLRDGELSVRTAVHTGDAEQRDDGRWLGPTLNRCARLRALAAGGQVLVSGATSELVVDSLPVGASLRDLGRHRLRDLTTPEHVRQLCHADLIGDFPPLRSLDQLPNNLPLQLTSFVGRERDLDEIGRLLDEHRVVTLTGAGGAGKTRLALHVVAERLDEAGDGVWLADLSPIVDPSLVPGALGAAIGLAEQPLLPMTDAITAHLAGQRVLVLLDNCEHLLDAAADLAENLIRSCPTVGVLATSREPLGIAGEVVYRVPSLAGADASRLFADRARAVRPAFTLDDRTSPPVAAICERLDGMPFAIELAAARVRAMAPAEIASQLSGRFRLLNSGRRGVLARQRTLEASVQWSYDLLTEPEQIVLRRLSVFAGGFTMALAEAVVASDGIDEWEVSELVTALVDRSLVQPRDDNERTRYRLLEAVRVFASGRLDDAGEVEAMRERHLHAMAAWASTLESAGGGASASLSWAEAQEELDNIRSALDWAIDGPLYEAGLHLLAVSIPLFGWQPVEITRWTQPYLAVDGGAARDRGAVMVFDAGLAMNWGDRERANTLVVAALELAQRHDDALLRGRAQLIRGLVGMFQSDASALDDLHEGAAALEELRDLGFLAGWGVEPTALMFAGEARKAMHAAEHLMAVTASVIDPVARAIPVSMAASVASFVGHPRRVRELAQRARALESQVTTFWEGNLRLAEALAASGEGDHARALVIVEAELDRARRYMLPLNLANATSALVWVRHWAGLPWDDDLAAEAQSGLELVGWNFGSPVFAAFKAEYLLDQGDLGGAELAAEEALQIDAVVHGQIYEAPTLLAVARVRVAVGELTTADELAQQALTTSIDKGQDVYVPQSFDVLAAIAAASGKQAEAARLLGMADALFAEIEWTRSVGAQRAVEALDLDGFEAERAEGSALSRDDAIAFVMRGRGARGRPTFGWSSLTPTESDVVRLVAEGLRNKQIAEKLLMSEATVKTHLTHVFAKLGVSNRAELAAQASRR